ncbi:MAG: AAA family ATPase [Campylobacteraceae bacterium]|nr:AAA family ATPase [Campylobacteraceae bacterium]
MSQDSKNTFDKNLKMMSISAAVLIALFVYTIYKSSAHIEGTQYYIGLVFLFFLLVASFGLRFYREKIKIFLDKKRQNDKKFNNFEKELSNTKSEPQKIKVKEVNYSDSSHIEAIASNITFDDVAGISNVKAELEEVVDFLNSPKKYLKHGVKLPKGVLLVGPPGVGKTLIARAVAGEAQVPFFYQSGASFVHIYVGMGAKRVKELFIKAKACAPAIIFIDEIDAVGKKRSGSSNDEREATLNELLTQMDGFEGDSGILIIAATNKIEVLDEALLRAGRFDRRVFLELPNISDRKKILELYLKNKHYDFDLNNLANDTAGFSSAALSTLINESLLNMIKREDSKLNDEDIEIARNKVEFGKKEQKLLNTAQKEILAIYQASKAFISQETISLFDEGIKRENEVYPSKSKLLKNIKKYLSGSIGIEVIKHEMYAVNSEDLKHAYDLANDIVVKYNMSNNTDELLIDIKNELRSELSRNSKEILRLKDLMLENEVITLENITNAQ